jgi:hypothetical protein
VDTAAIAPLEEILWPEPQVCHLIWHTRTEQDSRPYLATYEQLINGVMPAKLEPLGADTTNDGNSGSLYLIRVKPSGITLASITNPEEKSRDDGHC